MAAGSSEEQQRSLAERLNALFALTRWADAAGRQREYSTAEVAKAVTSDPSHGANLSRSYLSMLRNGSHTNPTLNVLEGIAKFFDDHRPREHRRSRCRRWSPRRTPKKSCCDSGSPITRYGRSQ